MAKLFDESAKQEPNQTIQADNTNRVPRPTTATKVVTYASFILIIPMFLYVGKRNNLIRLQNQINEAASGIDVQLKNRRDTLVKLVDAAKSSIKFEKETLTQVTQLRTGAITPQNRTQVDSALSSLGRQINVAFENYPNLRSVEAIKQLMDTSYSIEQEIAATRRLYNSYVREFNTGLFTWPGTVVAAGMKLDTIPMFQATAEDRTDVSTQLM